MDSLLFVTKKHNNNITAGQIMCSCDQLKKLD